MSFLLRKWYFDLLTGRGEYVYVYFAYMKVAGHTIRSLTVHLAQPGSPETTRSFIIPVHEERTAALTRGSLRLPCGEIDVGEESCSLGFSSGDCRVNLRYEGGTGEVGPPVNIATGKRSRIEWQPVALKYRVTGTVEIGNSRLVVSGADGYADVLESTCLPLLVPARTLYWGRVHHPEVDLSYVHALGKKGETLCSSLYIQRTGLRPESGPLTFGFSAPGVLNRPWSSGGVSYTLGGETASCRLTARVHRLHPIQQSGFIDQQDLSSGLARWLVRVFTRDPGSTKYLSGASLSLDLPEGEKVFHNVRLIDEIALL